MPANKGKIKYTEQEVLNNSFNENTALIETQIYGQDVVNDGARKIAVNPEGQLEVVTQPINPINGDNHSLIVTENLVGTVTTKTITKIINAISYIKTVTIDSSDNSVIVSVWSVV